VGNLRKKATIYNRNLRVETGFFEGKIPYAKYGNKPDILISIEALSFRHEPPSGFMLKQFIGTAERLSDNYTVYQIGRKQNVPEDYTFTDMARDYAQIIQRQFKKPVVVIGASTGGQIAHYLAADYPDLVHKLIIISAAYRVSERGAEIEKRSAEYFRRGKYGRSLAVILELIFTSKLKRFLAKILTIMLGRFFIGKIDYPNDFLTEVEGDITMDFKERLREIKTPTLILSGKLDIEYTAELVKETADGIPNAELKLYDGYGHNLAANWNVLEKDILEFLE
jgi:pimeloyl-ACP methyl ester carboxylesterase